MKKLVRESIQLSHFTEEDSDPIKDMSIGSKALIKKWFETWAPDVKYTVDNNLNVKVEGDLYLYNTLVTELPDNLSIGGWLDLRRSQITKLPDNLSVGGGLYLRGTQITELPKSLKVKGTIYKDF